jgi:GcrA cell cycle regulator
MRQQTTWTDERIVLLRERWAEGVRAVLIAQELGGVTKSATIAKAGRLGLGEHKSETARKAKPPSRRRKPATEPAQRVWRVRAPKAPPVDLPFLPPPDEALYGFECTTLELADNSCRWPLWQDNEPVKLHCGADRMSGSSYCWPHHRRATA